jgi:hypothetical protein
VRFSEIKKYLRSLRLSAFALKSSTQLLACGVNKKKPGQKAGQENGTSLGGLIPNGSLREASEPAPGYSAFLKKDPSSSLTHALILIKDQPFDIAE